MKKPLIVLVDDEPAVLEALEAELAPRFREIARVEAFESASALIERLPEWEAEQRSIAVAIVDQKMPGMTGVELLCALRASVVAAAAEAHHPARHMRAVLLTGYAGLDSALTAKNEAGVDRYREKPWSSEELARDARQLMRAWAMAAGADRHLLLREAVSAEDLRALFRLRYDVYSADAAMKYYIRPNESRLEADAFDVGARFGLVAETGFDTMATIGGFRFVRTEPWPDEGHIVGVVADEPDLARRAASPRPAPLPLFELWPDRALVQDFIDTAHTASAEVAECGRLTVAAGSRRFMDAGEGVALLLHQGAAALGVMVLGLVHVLIHCSVLHARAYSRMGFVRLSGTEPRFEEGVGVTQVIVHGAPSAIPELIRPCIESLGRALKTRGAACRCPAFSFCHPAGAYDADEFGAADVFCPRKAVATLRPTVNP